MGTKQVRLDADLYAYIVDENREDETISETIERLTTDWTLSEWGTDRSQAEIERHRELLEDLDEQEQSETEELLAELGVEE